MKYICIEEIKYELIDNYKDAFNEEQFKEKCTDYFYDYDYIIGDIAYGRLRLKGFYDHNNKKAQKINDFDNKDNYFLTNCASDCKYFIVKKIN